MASSTGKHSAINEQSIKKSTTPRKSECEELVERIETRHANRLPVTMLVRKRLLKKCRKIAKDKGYPHKNKITLDDLIGLHKAAKAKLEHKQKAKGKLSEIAACLGFLDPDETFVKVLHKALVVVRELQSSDDEWFYFQDFSFYHTHVVSRWPWLRSHITIALGVIFLYYLITPILFCHIVGDENVCPSDPTDENRSYYGWVNALYFASTTMSTVGYGDVTVDKDEHWRVWIGSLYMIAAMVVGITAFSIAADVTLSPMANVYNKIFYFFDQLRTYKKDQLLYQQISRIRFVKITEIVMQFVALNLVGVFGNRIFVAGVEESSLTWSESFYWAIQTTTTIGYGDLNTSFQMHWFQIFYLMISTYLVGSTLGKLGSMKRELDETRRRFAWERREVSKAMIDDMQAYDHDDEIDEYEFLVASLVALGKITSNDVESIMSRFRILAGEDMVITIDDAERNMAQQAEDDNSEFESEFGKSVLNDSEFSNFEFDGEGESVPEVAA